MFRYAIAFSLLMPIAWGQQPFTGTFLQITNGRTNANQLWAITETTLYRTDDQGKTYRGIRLLPTSPQPKVAQVLVDHRDSNQVFALTSETDPRLFRTLDAGTTWTLIGQGLPQGISLANSPLSLHQSLAQPEALYVRIAGRVYKSTDNGRSFTVQSTLPVATGIFVLALSNPRIMYASSDSSTSGVAYSTDEGTTWTRAGNLPQGPGDIMPLSARPRIVVNPRNPDQIFGYFLVTYPFANSTTGRNVTDALYTSNDGARTWSLSPSTVTFPNGLAVSLDGALLLVSSGLTPYRSTDFGATLTRLTSSSIWFINAADSSRVINAEGRISQDGARTFAPLSATYLPLVAPLPAINLTLETQTSLDIYSPFDDTEGKALTFAAAEARVSQPWVRIAPGPVTRGLSYSIQAHQLPAGDYQAMVELGSTGIDQPVSQTIQLRVKDRIEPDLRYRFRRIAGNGSRTFGGDGGPALQAGFESGITALAVEGSNLLVATSTRLRRINTSGTIQTISGGAEGRDGAGDGGPALQARYRNINSVLASGNNIYIVDSSDTRVRLIGSDGSVSTFFRPSSASGLTSISLIRRNAAGDLFLSSFNNISRFDGTQFRSALPASFNPLLSDFALANSGELLIVDSSRLWRQRPVLPGTPAEPQRLIAGNQTPFFSGDHAPASTAQFNFITATAEDSEGNLFILERNRLRVIRPSGIVQTVAGNGDSGLALKDGDLANSAGLGSVRSMALDPQGRIYIGTSDGIVYVLERATGVAPRIASGGVVSLAAGSPRIAPGAIFSIYGTELSPATEANARVPLSQSLSGVQVLVNGAPVGLFFVSPGQINAQMPWTATGTARIVVSRSGVNSAEQTATIATTQPDILTYGTNRAVAVNANGAINSESAPAAPNEPIVVYLTGIGAVDQPVAPGAASPSSPLARAAAPSSATIGGQPAQLLYLGLAPGFVGLAQANLLVPPDLTPGDHPLSIRIGAGVSNQPLIQIR